MFSMLSSAPLAFGTPFTLDCKCLDASPIVDEFMNTNNDKMTRAVSRTDVEPPLHPQAVLGTLEVDMKYPSNYGVGCAAHDKDLGSHCNAAFLQANDMPPSDWFGEYVPPTPPDWCHKPFCWVDPDNCNDSENGPSAYFKPSDPAPDTAYYSYAACGAKDTYTGGEDNNDALGIA